MRSSMMDVPLRVSSILVHAADYHGDTEIVSRTPAGPLHRTNYAQLRWRCERLANGLVSLGVGEGERVGTLALNGYRHLEIYFAVAGAGRICHTLNPRLHADQLIHIINSAGDVVLFVETQFAAVLESIARRLTTVRTIVMMTDAAGLPVCSRLPSLLSYEELLATAPEGFAWPEVGEGAVASMCYTSGTSGTPKGVTYSHRSTVLHAMAACAPDVFDLSARSVVMPVVPMFHVNAWGLPYCAPMVGAKLVLPGARLDGASLHELMVTEQVTFAAGVPTVWAGLIDWARANRKTCESLRRVVIGGSACTPGIADWFAAGKVEVVHAWGMTETSPVALACAPKAKHRDLPAAERAGLLMAQGRPPFGVQVRIVNQRAEEVPHDGRTAGRLLVRGPWICRAYFEPEAAAPSAAVEWLDTGDIATIDADGYVRIVDRAKDLIKSGGEWISSIELETIASTHAAVKEAAVVARPDPKWGERPVLVIVLNPGCSLTQSAMVEHFSGKVARWCIPDEVLYLDELPRTASGKVQKNRLRELLA